MLIFLEFLKKFKLDLHPEGDPIGNMYVIPQDFKKKKKKEIKEKQTYDGETDRLQKCLIYKTLLLVIQGPTVPGKPK